jgi:hypothetical protein
MPKTLHEVWLAALRANRYKFNTRDYGLLTRYSELYEHYQKKPEPHVLMRMEGIEIELTQNTVRK